MTNEKIALITDSTCDLPDEVLKEYDIRILPLKILYPDRSYDDRLDISPDEVYATLDEERPKTSMPSPGKVAEVLNELVREGFTHAIAIHLSSGLSGTRDVVKMVSEQIQQSLKVEVIDSRAVSMALGFLVREAGALIRRGLGFEEVVERVRSLRERMRVFFIVRTLEYLRRNGRIGYVQAAVGGILDVKPIISIGAEGKYYTYVKVRGWHKALARLVDIVREKAGGKKIVVAVMHGAALKDGQELCKGILNSGLQVQEMVFGQIGPSMVVHAGPGLVGVAFYEV
ncbi:MAG: DegV family protein [Bacillota bacterium]|uniref:DegV family protein n=1 Tax=Desulforudis sp. DRI-14 TaxID=3459793 RepID=UPI00346FC138